jgi:predicted AlkP superfamily pyrophosphatase or phosphodiesterase
VAFALAPACDGRSRRVVGLAALLVLGIALGCAKLRDTLPGKMTSDALPVLGGAERAPARVVFVSVAGLTPSAYLTAPGVIPNMPTLAGMAQAGAAAETVEPVAPASSYPASASLVTGRSPAHHGVTADRVLGDHGSEARRATPRPPLRAPTLWDAVSTAGRRSVVLGWPGSSGGHIDLVFPESFVAEPGEDWPTWMASHTSPGILESARQLGAEAPGVAAPGPERDRLLVGLACDALASKAPPALLLVHLSQTEAVLAATGPASVESQQAFAAVDRELARLVACLREADFLDSTAVLVAGDHGALPLHTAVSPNVALRQVGLLVPAISGGGIQRWSAVVRSNGGSGFVYARNEQDARLARRALEIVGTRTNTFRIVPAREMLERGADPEAWFGLEALEGFTFSEEVSGDLLTPAPARAGWGNLAGGPALAPGFVAWGRGVRGGVRIPTMRQTDVAPTVAVLLGFEVGSLEGEPVAAMLALPAVAAAPASAPVPEKEPAHGH